MGYRVLQVQFSPAIIAVVLFDSSMFSPSDLSEDIYLFIKL